MNPDAPRTPREELEIKITALIMGQLSAEEAAEVEAQIAADPELAALHARLRHAAHLLRESRTMPEPAAHAEPLQLSRERRENLLATFRGIKPLPSPLPAVVPRVPKVEKKHQRDLKWIGPIALAASIAVLIGGGVVILSIGVQKIPHDTLGRTSYDFTDSNHSSLGDQSLDFSKQRTSGLDPSASATPALLNSGDADFMASTSENRWWSQPGAIRDFSGGKSVSDFKLYSADSMSEAKSSAAPEKRPVVGSGQVVPGAVGLPGTLSGRVGGGSGETSRNRVYLPSGTSNAEGRSDQPLALDVPDAGQLARADSVAAAKRPLPSSEYEWRSEKRSGAEVSAKADPNHRAGVETKARDTGSASEAIGNPTALGEKTANADGAVSQFAGKEMSKSGKNTPAEPGNRPLGSAAVTAGNRSGNLAMTSNAIDALLFDPPGTSEATKREATAQSDGLKDSPSDGEGGETTKKLAKEAEDYTALGRHNMAARKYEEILEKDPNNVAARKGREEIYRLKTEGADAAYDAARSAAIYEVQSQWERPYRRFDRKASEIRGENKPGETQEVAESAMLADDASTQGRDPRSPSTPPAATNGAPNALEPLDSAGENTFWDIQSADTMARSKSRETAFRELKEDTKSGKTAENPVALNFGGIAVAPATPQDGEFDRADPDPLAARFGMNASDGTRPVAPLTPTPVVAGTAKKDEDYLEHFAAPQIPQTFGNAPGWAGIAVATTPTTPEKPNTALGLESAPAVDGYSISTPLATAGKVELNGEGLAPFTPPALPAQSSPNTNPPAGPVAESKPAAAATPAQKNLSAQEKFVGAFLTVRKAEENAAAGDAQNAQKLYREAADDLAKIKQQWPEWQPELLEYRLKRTEEALTQVELKIAPAKEEPAAGALPPPAEESPAPAKAPEPAPVPQPEVSTKENAFSTFSLNVSDVSFQLAGASLEKGVLPEPATVRSEEFINALNYRDPEPGPDAPFAFASERARYPFAHNRDLLRLSVKTAAAGREPGKPLNLVLLLDNSGSMERADRVRILKESLRVLAQQLQPQDKLSLITFSRTPRLWADGVSGEKAGEITQRVGEITPQGGTDLSAAMDLGYQTALKHYQVGSVNRVVLLTDGAANLGDVKAEALKAKVETHRKQGVAFDCFGVGWEGYNDDLLEQLSRNGDGRYGFINSPEAAATEFAGQLAGALRVAASDVKVQVEFNPRRVLAYRQVGYAKHQLKKEQFRDNTVDAAEIGAAESGNALYVIEVNPRGEGDIATVRVRFKVPGTSDYQEHDWTVPFQAPAPAMEQSSSSLRLAATASAFSEWLAQSPFASEVTTDRLLGMINGIPAIYGADGRPAKLESMIRQAKSISGR